MSSGSVSNNPRPPADITSGSGPQSGGSGYAPLGEQDNSSQTFFQNVLKAIDRFRSELKGQPAQLDSTSPSTSGAPSVLATSASTTTGSAPDGTSTSPVTADEQPLAADGQATDQVAADNPSRRSVDVPTNLILP